MDCLIIESHGPIYRGIDKVKEWIDQWFDAGDVVNQWEITSLHCVDDVAFFEWHFVCTVEGQRHAFGGASLVKFKQQKIVVIQEYRMTAEAFEWTGD